jgi:ribosomal protein S18 acetylase RimI-like enzyme
MSTIEIQALTQTADTHAMLVDMLIETVAVGGSVSFMHPLAPDVAGSFWSKSLIAAERGERAVLGAWDGDALIGTVTLLLDFPPNQPHRAEIAKLMTRVDRRGKGVATRLMRAAENLAVENGRTLLVLDTAAEEGASSLYEKLGFTLAGEIPDYALRPRGGLTSTLIYWKRIGQSR